MVSEALLELQDVHAGYGKLEILKGVSLQVHEGEIVALIGPNGAGKSTVLKTIFGFLQPTQGSLLFQGKEIGGWTPREALRAGMVFALQRDSVLPRLSVQDNVELGAFIRDDPQVKEDVERVMELFPVLKAKRRERAGRLSGGERQMVKIARALLLNPKLFLLDEPTIGLAPKVIQLIYEKIREINARGTTVLLVEQNAKTALQHANRAYVLEDGRVRFEGTGREILHHPEVRRAYLGG
jgi:ABC-type branched-subunit amino acid transport system ATPase component